MIKHMIFDLDGTILDTVPDLAFNLNQTFEDLNLNGHFSLSEVASFLGSGKDEQIRRALQARGYNLNKFAEVDAVLTTYYAQNVDRFTKPFPAVISTLEALKASGVNLYVATNKPEAVALDVVSKFFPTLFAIVRGDKGDGIVKPHASFLNEVLAHINDDINNILFIGDSYVDYLTAKGAGLKVALVTHGYDKNVFSKIDAATLVLPTFSALLEMR